MRVSAGAEEGALVGNNLRAHLQALEKDMRDAAADLDFEKAASLRDEIKRLQALELEVADDPMARDAGIANTQAARAGAATSAKGWAKRGDAGAGLFRKNTLDEMTVGRTEKPRRDGDGKKGRRRMKTGRPGR